MHRDYWHEGKSLKHRCRCVAAVLLLYTDFVASSRLSGSISKNNPPLFWIVFVCLQYTNTHSTHTQPSGTYKSAHKYTYIEAPVVVTKERAQSVAAVLP